MAASATTRGMLFMIAPGLILAARAGGSEALSGERVEFMASTENDGDFRFRQADRRFHALAQRREEFAGALSASGEMASKSATAAVLMIPREIFAPSRLMGAVLSLASCPSRHGFGLSTRR